MEPLIRRLKLVTCPFSQERTLCQNSIGFGNFAGAFKWRTITNAIVTGCKAHRITIFCRDPPYDDAEQSISSRDVLSEIVATICLSSRRDFDRLNLSG